MAQTWEPFEFISDLIHRKDLKVHPVTKLDMLPAQGKQTVLCQQHWQLHQLSASRLLQWPQHPTPQNEVLLPHLWVSLFMAQTGEPFEFISDFIHRKDLKVHPVTKLDMPPTQENSTVLCQQHWQLHQLSASRLLQWPQHPTPSK